MRAFLLSFLAVALCAQSPAEIRIKRDMDFLASRQMKGRGNGYPELDRAAEYLAGQYRKLGLNPVIQRYAFVKGVERVQGAASIGKGDTAGRPLEWGKDIEAYGFSADGEFRNRALAFVGYGVQTSGYDDYAGMDLARKVAVILRQVPDNPAFTHLDRMEKTLPARVKKLAQAGASAVIVLEDGGSVRALRKEEGPSRLDIPVLSMGLETLAPSCSGLKDRVAKLKQEAKPQSVDYVFAPWTFLNLDLKLNPIEAQLPNVAAVIPGSDPKLREEHIVLGAHFDHLGLGERHSMGGEAAKGEIHPGADDNASGTVMVLELARELKRHPLKRSVVLLHFSGEEEGLLGSSNWVKNPTVKLDSVKFMANFDMVGYLAKDKPLLMLGALGAPKDALEKAKALAPEGLSVSTDVGEMIGGSDHMSFSLSKIPTFFFFTGIHANYHRPSDTPDRINIRGVATLTAYAQKLVANLGNAPTTPAFDPETAKIRTRSGGAMRVAFGTIPDYGENPKGFRLQGVSPGGTAEKIGLKAGDILTAFGEIQVKGIYDYMQALGKYKPGDKVVVKWLREDKEMQAEALLKGRD
jgi:hypothetical protein